MRHGTMAIARDMATIIAVILIVCLVLEVTDSPYKLLMFIGPTLIGIYLVARVVVRACRRKWW